MPVSSASFGIFLSANENDLSLPLFYLMDLVDILLKLSLLFYLMDLVDILLRLSLLRVYSGCCYLFYIKFMNDWLAVC